ncbi:MAG: TVP38/TMEM64 family protein [Hyphomicrobiaceae bacterium]|nr:TVP38/TMEM64 family protein [Hyphomicrobiaceae bacterium]
MLDEMHKTPEPAGMAATIKRFLPLILIAGATVAVFASGLHEELSLSAIIRKRFELADMIEANFILSLLIFGAIYVLAVALSFPGASFLTIAAGFLFGWMAGGSTVVVAATIGATAIFLAARSALGRSLEEKAGPFLARLRDGFRKDAFSYLLFLRLTPLFPFWLINLAPAFLGVPLRSYVAATALGILPGTFAFAFLGTGLDSLIAAQEAANPGCAAAGTCAISAGSLVTPELLIAFTALGVVSLIPPVVKRLRRRSAAPEME